MKKVYIYALAYALTAVSCQDNEWGADSATPQAPEIEIPMGAADGELLIKFVPEMSDILDQTLTRVGGVATRSGIPSTDEVLNILGAYHFERVFPGDPKTEKRTREAGMHLWYIVRFDKDDDLKEAARQLKILRSLRSADKCSTEKKQT